MEILTKFLREIGHTDRVKIRCLAPKNTPMPELEARGMTWTTKDDDLRKSTVDGYLNLSSGEFDRIPCELLQLNDVCYSLEQFDRTLPELDYGLPGR